MNITKKQKSCWLAVCLMQWVTWVWNSSLSEGMTGHAKQTRKQQQRLAPPTDQRTNPFQQQLRPSMTSQKNAHGWLASHNGGLLFREGLWGNSMILFCRRICWRDSKSPEFIVLQTPWNNDISNRSGRWALESTPERCQSQKFTAVAKNYFHQSVNLLLLCSFLSPSPFFPSDYFS